MRALQAIGIGLVIVGLRAGEPDLLPDPIGWLLVLAGVRRLPPGLSRRPALLVLALLALAASVPLWVPDLADRILAAEASLHWLFNLPQLGFVLVLASTLGQRADRAGDGSARGWWYGVATGTALAVLLPVAVVGGGVEALETPTLMIASTVLLGAIVLCFVHAGRPWLHAPESVADEG